MQLIHLVVSDAIWIALVLLAANALAVEQSALVESTPQFAPLTERTV